MPLYDFRCDGCGKVSEDFRRYENRDDPAQCDCGQPLTRVWVPAQVMSDIDGYQSMVDGSWISSRSQHRDHLKRHGVRELGNDKPTIKRETTIPREVIRTELRSTVERMKAQGTFRER